MKKIIFGVLITCLLVLTQAASADVFTREVDKKWDAVTVAVDTNWFASDIRPSTNSERLNSNTIGAEGISSPADNPVKHTFQFSCPTATVVNMQLKYAGITSVHNFNAGAAIGIDNGMQFSVILHSGMKYNIQHKTATQACKVIITESFNANL
jgi:hypothetical protein